MASRSCGNAPSKSTRAAKPCCSMSATKLRRRPLIAREIARDRQPPRQRGDRRQRRDEDIEALARHDRAHRQKAHRAVGAAFGGCATVGARRRDRDVFRRNLVVLAEPAPGGRARHDDRVRSGQRRALAFEQLLGILWRQSGLERERMMHQRNQRCAPRDRLRFLRQRAERQSVDHDRHALRNGLQPRQRNRALLGAGARKSVAQRHDIHLPAEHPQFRDDAPVVAVTAGRRREIARHRKRDAIHHRARLVPGARHVRFLDLHADRVELAAVAAKLTRARRRRELVEHVLRQEFRRGVLALELRQRRRDCGSSAAATPI